MTAITKTKNKKAAKTSPKKTSAPAGKKVVKTTTKTKKVVEAPAAPLKGRRVPDGPCAFPGTDICPMDNADKASSPYPYQKGCRNAVCKAANSAYYGPWREKKRAAAKAAAKKAAAGIAKKDSKTTAKKTVAKKTTAKKAATTSAKKAAPAKKRVLTKKK